ncbi:MAG TPA: DNA gyrase C-terminal beta-propeller domain-containing protein, partial [Microbacteriaceae bacterium]
AGVAIRINASDIPPVESAEQLSSIPSINQFLELGADRVVSIIGLSNEPVIAIGTKNGVVKRISELPEKDSFKIITLSEGDEVIAAANSDEFLFFATTSGQVLKFDANSVRPQGLSAGGMQGIKLAAEDQVVGFGAANDEQQLITAAEAGDGLLGAEFGRGKSTLFSEIPKKGRATQGVRVQRFSKADKHLYFAKASQRSECCSGDSREAFEASKRDVAGQSLSFRVIGVH